MQVKSKQQSTQKQDEAVIEAEDTRSRLLSFNGQIDYTTRINLIERASFSIWLLDDHAANAATCALTKVNQSTKGDSAITVALLHGAVAAMRSITAQSIFERMSEKHGLDTRAEIYRLRLRPILKLYVDGPRDLLRLLRHLAADPRESVLNGLPQDDVSLYAPLIEQLRRFKVEVVGYNRLEDRDSRLLWGWARAALERTKDGSGFLTMKQLRSPFFRPPQLVDSRTAKPA